jgi:hypothetical protein
VQQVWDTVAESNLDHDACNPIGDALGMDWADMPPPTSTWAQSILICQSNVNSARSE